MVKLPSHRRDLKTSIDLVEEVARLEGYDSIPLNRPQSTATYRRLNENFFNFESHVKAALSSLGFHETIHYSFTSEDQLRRCGKLTEKTVALKNPLNEEMKVMRTSLLPSLLNTYAYNHNRKITDQRIFEVSRSYEQDSRLETGVKESLLASALISGLDFPNDWKWKSKAVDFFTLKGFLEALLREVTTASVEFAPFQEDTSTRLFHPRRSAHVLVHGQRIGDIGEVHPYFKDKVLGTQESVVLFEIAVDPLKRMARGLPKFESLSKFPGVEFDLAFVVTKDTPQASVHALLDDGKRTTVKKVRLFDVYEGENLPPGKKSLAYRIYLQSPDRTLSEQEIEKTRNELISSLKEKVGAELRA
jgi:phenylalanyl-tRNA synthetase beta chain